VHAISKEDRSIQLNESLCIGCKMCALACPFGVVVAGGTAIPKLEFNAGQYSYVHSPFQPEPMALRELALDDRLSLLNWEVGRKTVAVKCDLCYFSEDGPACVIACPHKALRLVDDEIFENAAMIEGMKDVSVAAIVESLQA
jgi:hydrogenase-4 component A